MKCASRFSSLATSSPPSVVRSSRFSGTMQTAWGRWRRAIRCISSVAAISKLSGTVSVSAVVFAILTWGSTAEAIKQTARGAYVEAGTMRVPTWPSYWILPFSFGRALIVIAIRMLEVLTGTFDDGKHDVMEQLESLGEYA